MSQPQAGQPHDPREDLALGRIFFNRFFAVIAIAVTLTLVAGYGLSYAKEHYYQYVLYMSAGMMVLSASCMVYWIIMISHLDRVRRWRIITFSLYAKMMIIQLSLMTLGGACAWFLFPYVDVKANFGGDRHDVLMALGAFTFICTVMARIILYNRIVPSFR